MVRTRLSTTVNGELLGQARALHAGGTDAALLDAALESFIAQHRRAEINATYAAYDDHPLTEKDDWGDLESFRRAAAGS